MKQPYNTALYYRLSRDDENFGDSVSIETQRTILQQFVIEAAVTSSLGGVAGILIGCAATKVVGTMIGISATPTLSAVLISFGVSVAIGLFFGYMPARRAANLNPIDALRSE